MLSCQLLYECHQEDDETNVIHALLLMSSWSSPEDAEENSQWASSAIAKISSSAHQTGNSQQLSERHIQTRLWWACFIRDQLISFNCHKPPSMNTTEPLGTLVEGLSVSLDEGYRVQKETEQRAELSLSKTETQVANIFIQLAKHSLNLHQALLVAAQCELGAPDSMMIDQAQSFFKSCLEPSRASGSGYESIDRDQHMQLRINADKSRAVQETILSTITLMTLVTVLRLSDSSRPAMLSTNHKNQLSRKIQAVHDHTMGHLRHLNQCHATRHLPSHFVDFLLQQSVTEALSNHCVAGAVEDFHACGFQRGMELVQRVLESQEDGFHVDYRTRFLDVAIAATLEPCGASQHTDPMDDIEATPSLIISQTDTPLESSSPQSPTIEDLHQDAHVSIWQYREESVVDPRKLAVVADDTRGEYQSLKDSQYQHIEVVYKHSPCESLMPSADNDFDTLFQASDSP